MLLLYTHTTTYTLKSSFSVTQSEHMPNKRDTYTRTQSLTSGMSVLPFSSPESNRTEISRVMIYKFKFVVHPNKPTTG